MIEKPVKNLSPEKDEREGYSILKVHKGALSLPQAQKQLGKELRKLRKEQGLMLGWVANKVGISRVYLSEIERGKRNPSFFVVCSIYRLLQNLKEAKGKED